MGKGLNKGGSGSLVMKMAEVSGGHRLPAGQDRG